MKKISFLLFFFLLLSCNNNTVYLCGDHVCANKKERKNYFNKTLTVEAVEVNKKNIKDEKIFKLNKSTDKKTKVSVDKISFHERFFGKNIEKKPIDTVKNKIATKLKPKKEIKLNKNIKKNTKFNETVLNNEDGFNDFVNKITNKNKNKPYRDINDIPD